MENVPPDVAARMIFEVFEVHQHSSIRIAKDESSNRIIVAATEDRLKIVEALLRQLDKADRRVDRQTQMFHISRPVDGGMRNALDLTVQGTDVEYTFDPQRGLLMAHGKGAELELFADTLQALDGHPDDNEPQTLRVTWLMNRENRETKPANLPHELGPVILSLKRPEIDQLKIATQLIGSVGSSEETFSVTGTPEPVTVYVNGERLGRGSNPTRLQLTIHTKQATVLEGELEFRTVAGVETNVSRRPGQLVVLGVAPLGSRQSVFVVQLARWLFAGNVRRTPDSFDTVSTIFGAGKYAVELPSPRQVSRMPDR